MSTNPTKRRPEDRQTEVKDEGSLHLYRTEIPNTVIRGIKSRGLSTDAKWLYVYLKSVIGEDGRCWRTTTTIALESGLSRSAVSRAKQELLKARLIRIEKGSRRNRDTDKLSIRDIWPENMQEFRRHEADDARQSGVSLGNTEKSSQAVDSQDETHVCVSLGNTENSSVSLGNTENLPEVFDNTGDSNVSVSLGNAK